MRAILDAGPLIESEDWADNALALLAKGGREKALEVAESLALKPRAVPASNKRGNALMSPPLYANTVHRANVTTGPVM